jgi:hypothetical protein
MDPQAATNAFLGAQLKQSPPLEGTASAANAIARVSYTHDAMIDLILTNPAISQNAIAQHFGYKAAWVSRIFCSDAFQARLAQRKHDTIDPVIGMSMDEKIKAMASRSLDIIQDKLEQSPTLDTAFKAFEMSTKALGYGAKAANVAVQQNFIVPMPAKAASAQEWAAAHQGLAAGKPIDVVDME